MSYLNYKYNQSVIGGTFDRLHDGHKFFIDVAFKNSKFVTIGLTKKSMLISKVLNSKIESFSDRKKNLIMYLQDKDYFKRANIISITDVYGSSTHEKDLESIYIIESGLKNALIINEKRKDLDLPELEIITVPIIKDDLGVPLSSTRLRISKKYKNIKYADKFSNSKTLLLPNNLRKKFREPIGNVYKNLLDYDFTHKKFILAVGDIVTSELIKIGVSPTICIYDFKTNRSRIDDKKILDLLPKANYTLLNSAGSLNSETVLKLVEIIENQKKTNQRIAIAIYGEEDLLTLPAILFSPKGAIVVYGIYNEGAIIVEVTERLKKEIEENYLNNLLPSNE